MNRIAVLPSHVADQIAAGEVVERPASAVKELVENSLDAGATSIEIEVEDGGRALIRVSDDGSGMGRDDALLSLERHATSKIRVSQDLVGVASFGFRGEALPAICSVARLEVTTSMADGAGTMVRAAGGMVESVEDASRRRGTTVVVSQLFYNTPARRKFLKGARSEWRAISDAAIAIALTRPDVHLTLVSDGRPALTLPAARSLRARVGAIWGAPFTERFLDVNHGTGPILVQGMVERPGDVGTASRRTFLMVNGRSIRDHGIVRAAEAAYRSTLAPGLRPSMFLEILLPSDAVDVNVHPAKAEVRFHERWGMERIVEQAVRRALGEPDAAAAFGARPALHWNAPQPLPPRVDVEVLQSRDDASGLFAPADDTPDETMWDVKDGGTSQPVPGPRLAEADLRTLDVPALTQLRRTWIMCERDEGMVLIDQHSAHERILYERFMQALERGDAPSQRLLFPETLHLGPADADAFEEHQVTFNKLGYEIELFGGHSLIVHAVPAPHKRFDAFRCLRESLQALTGDRVASSTARHEKLVATVACKAAIKAGDVLAPDEMRALFVALAGTTLPAHDVHGRSTIVHLSWNELERRFGRA